MRLAVVRSTKRRQPRIEISIDRFADEHEDGTIQIRSHELHRIPSLFLCKLSGSTDTIPDGLQTANILASLFETVTQTLQHEAQDWI